MKISASYNQITVAVRRRTIKMVRRLSLDGSGSFTIMFAMSALVVVVLIGMGLDYLTGLSFKSRWDTSADAAAIAAIQGAVAYVTANAASQSGAALSTGAIAAGEAQGAKVFRANAGASEATETVTAAVTVTEPSGTFNATVTYTGTVATHFGKLVGTSTLAVSGTAVATAGLSTPNIDFYLLLDNSPSMALPASAAGISTLSALTTGGCAFACHEANANSSDIASNPVVNGQHIDNYQVARNNGITLRIDELNSGTTNLMATATSYANASAGTKPSYRFAVDSMDSTYSLGFVSVMPLTSNYLTGWEAAFNNFQLMEMYQQNESCLATTTHGVTNPCGAGYPITANGQQTEAETDYDNAFAAVNAQMPVPGDGTNVPGDSPQEVLFVVTDGLEDEISGGKRLIGPVNGEGDRNYCTDIKNRGIKIAILYTTYLSIVTDEFYEQYVAPIQDDIGPALQACASPGMFFQAGIDDNLTADFATLFQLAIGQGKPRLTQ